MTNRKAATEIVSRLKSHGFEALLAGGCVRDMLLGRTAKDYDVATDARPADVIKLFRRTLKVGAKFGVVMVLMDDHQIEVATFRTESGYADGRHPTTVKFSTAAKDASRRDFTINGMFYDPTSEEVKDYVGGREDLKKRLIRTIGRPEQRFSEDYLRMLRAVRFSTELDFKIEQHTWRAICTNAQRLTGISGERIAAELERILVHPNRQNGAEQLLTSGLWRAVFPDLDNSRAKFAIRVLAELPDKVDLPLGLAALFAGCETDFAMDSLSRLKLSRKQTGHIKFLLDRRSRLLNADMSVAELKLLAGEPYFWDLYEFQKAIQKAANHSLTALKKVKRRALELAGLDLRPKPLLDGHELIRLGAVPGPQVGQLAREMYIAQLEGELKTANEARQWVKQWLRNHKWSQ